MSFKDEQRMYQLKGETCLFCFEEIKLIRYCQCAGSLQARVDALETIIGNMNIRRMEVMCVKDMELIKFDTQIDMKSFNELKRYQDWMKQCR